MLQRTSCQAHVSLCRTPARFYSVIKIYDIFTIAFFLSSRFTDIMATIKFHDHVIQTSGSLPAVGQKAPDFRLVGSDLSNVSLADFAGKTLVLNIFPSVDTPVCANSVRKFNESASSLPNAAVLCVSMDLPFATGRFCGAEGLKNVKTASDYRTHEFSKIYGVRMNDGPLAGLCARAVVVVGPDGNVKYTELVPVVEQEPNYDAALAAAK